MVHSKNITVASGRKQRIEGIVKNLSAKVRTKKGISAFNGVGQRQSESSEPLSTSLQQRGEGQLCSTITAEDSDSVYHLPSGLEFSGIVSSQLLSKGNKFGPFIGRIASDEEQIDLNHSLVCQIPDFDGNNYSLCLLTPVLESCKWLKCLKRCYSNGSYNVVAYNTPKGVVLETVSEVGVGAELCVAYDLSYDTLDKLEEKGIVSLKSSVDELITEDDRKFVEDWKKEKEKELGKRPRSTTGIKDKEGSKTKCKKKEIEKPAGEQSLSSDDQHTTSITSPFTSNLQPALTLSTTNTLAPVASPVSSPFTSNLQPALTLRTTNNIAPVASPLSSPLTSTNLDTCPPLSTLNIITSQHSDTPSIDVSSLSPESIHSNSSFNTPNLHGFPPDYSTSSLFTATQNLLPGEVMSSSNYSDNLKCINAQAPPTIERLKDEMGQISRKIDMVLVNQEIMIKCLQNNGLIDSPALTCSPTTASTVHITEPVYSAGCDEPPGNSPGNLSYGKEFTMEQLQALNRRKRKNTTDGYFAVLLLKELTTPDERINCTVYGEGRKSKGLNPDVLSKIKKSYELIYSNESWGDAINAMNNHLRKYCSTMKKTVASV